MNVVPPIFRAVINMTPFIPTFPNINPLERLKANPGIFQYQLYFHKEVSRETVYIYRVRMGPGKPGKSW